MKVLSGSSRLPNNAQQQIRDTTGPGDKVELHNRSSTRCEGRDGRYNFERDTSHEGCSLRPSLLCVTNDVFQSALADSNFMQSG